MELKRYLQKAWKYRLITATDPFSFFLFCFFFVSVESEAWASLWPPLSLKQQKNSGFSWGDYVKLDRDLASILFRKLNFCCTTGKIHGVYYIIIHSLNWECALATHRAHFHVAVAVHSLEFGNFFPIWKERSFYSYSLDSTYVSRENNFSFKLDKMWFVARFWIVVRETIIFIKSS